MPALWPALDSVRFNAAVRQTASFLDGVRQRAVMKRSELEVRCDEQEDQLLVVDEHQPIVAGEKNPFTIPYEVELSCAPRQVRYYAQGSTSTKLTLTLRGKGGRQRRIVVGAFTGLARPED
jgi:hypothetical protein